MKVWLALAAFYGLTAVILGALGAHALRGTLSTEALDAFRTGTHYQLVHAVALLALAFAMASHPGLKPVAVLWRPGRGPVQHSLLLTCHPLLGLAKMRWWGPITPLGGLLMILGWAWLLVHALRLKHPASPPVKWAGGQRP